MNTISRSAFVVILFGMLSIAKPAQAGDVQGKITATGLKSPGGIVIYIDAIPGKKFDRPTDHVSVDQKNMLFVPHTLVILRGTTVDFLNSDQVAHNVYWPSVGGNKNLKHSLTVVSPGQKKSSNSTASAPRRSAICIRTCWATSSWFPHRTSR